MQRHLQGSRNLGEIDLTFVVELSYRRERGPMTQRHLKRFHKSYVKEVYILIIG